MKKLSLIVLGILIAAQFAVPFSMIRSRENILRNGELFRFKTRPIDPVDPFQGRYVRLRMENEHVPCSINDKRELHRNTPLFAFIGTDEEGFARYTSYSMQRPKNGDYLKSKYVRGWRNRWNETTQASDIHEIQIYIPFNRYYMDEAKAPRAERLARESTRSTNCWVAVRILDGKAVIEDVFAEGQPLRDLAAGD